MGLLRHWLIEGTQKHSRCVSHVDPTGPTLPTRILDLGDNTSSIITLREPKGETGRYICLSYCWGKAQFLKTTPDNLERHKGVIHLQALPATFRDTVHVARVIGVRYVWIDSLCIIQDDEDHADWKQESGRMADVYRNSYLTVAATGTDSADGGCFTEPDNDIDLGSVAMRQMHHFPSSLKPENYTHFPLLTRAWAYQERMLSPRVVHFGRQELLWECRGDRTCECGQATHSKHEVRKTDFHDTTSEFRSAKDRSPAQIWRQMVVECSQAQLTYATDKLPAFSGLADEMQRNSEQQYLAGLWRDSLVLDMCWYRNDHGKTNQSPLAGSRAPSWSWASVDGPITYNSHLFGHYSPNTSVVCFPEVLAAGCSLHGPSLTGQVNNGFVKLKSSLLPVRVEMGKVYAGSKSLKWWLYSDGNHEVEEAHGHYYLILMAEVDVTFLTLVVTPINPDLDECMWEFIWIGLAYRFANGEREI